MGDAMKRMIGTLSATLLVAVGTVTPAVAAEYEDIDDGQTWIVGEHVVVTGLCWEEPDPAATLQVRRGKKWVSVAKASFVDDAAYCSDDAPYLSVYEFTLTDTGRRYSLDRSNRLSVRADLEPGSVYSWVVYANQADYDADLEDLGESSQW